MIDGKPEATLPRNGMPGDERRIRSLVSQYLHAWGLHDPDVLQPLSVAFAIRHEEQKQQVAGWTENHLLQEIEAFVVRAVDLAKREQGGHADQDPTPEMILALHIPEILDRSPELLTDRSSPLPAEGGCHSLHVKAVPETRFTQIQTEPLGAVPRFFQTAQAACLSSQKWLFALATVSQAQR